MDSAFHILSGCQCPYIRNMVTERHNIASRMTLKVVSKGCYGSNRIQGVTRGYKGKKASVK
eukprot:382176-Pelagomonas_calceolata.AAC.1